MLSRQFVRENPRDGTGRHRAQRASPASTWTRSSEIDEEWRGSKAHGDDLRHQRNEVSSQIGEYKREGEEEQAQEAIERSSEIKAELQDVEDRADELEAELEERLLEIPQRPHDSVPVGEDESDNVERSRVGFDDLRDLPADVVPHYDLGEELDILDFERGAKVSGGGFQFVKGDGARLERALIQFMLDVHREQEYVEVSPPIPVNSASMRGTGQLPKFDEDAYRVGARHGDDYDDDDLWLLPTAEVPVTNMYRDEILLDDDLPVKHQAFSPNFRREAGEHGTETRGYVRVHQFNKVELVNFVRPKTATTAWRASSTKQPKCWTVSNSPTASWTCAPATWASPRPRSTTSRCGPRRRHGRGALRRADAGSKFRRSPTSRSSRPAAPASTTGPSATSPRSTSTRSTAAASPLPE